RYTPRGTPETTGRQSSGIFRRCCLLKCRYCLGDEMIRVALPYHLRNLAKVDDEVKLEVQGQITLSSVLEALEARYPMLRGTIRDQVTGQRRPFLRFFACEEDLSHESPDAPLPAAVAAGAGALLGGCAIAGGGKLI